MTAGNVVAGTGAIGFACRHLRADPTGSDRPVIAATRWAWPKRCVVWRRCRRTRAQPWGLVVGVSTVSGA